MVNQSFDFNQLHEGLQNLVIGYIDYSKSVITYRALPDLRDGLKPVNRCTLYVVYKNKDKGKTKSQKISGEVIASYHPHGDVSVYDAFVPLTTAHKGMQIPLLFGDGNFSNVASDERWAAPRYTEVAINKDALYLYCDEMSGINMINNFDSTTTMPELFPVKFPAVLCNAQEGVAVGFRGKMPSFNLIDVCNLTKEYLRDGQCSTVIAPDFMTGGYYIKNNKELQKLMTVGVGKIKLRGRVEINDKDIVIVEFPYGKKSGKLLKQIDDKNIPGVKVVKDLSQYNEIKISIECTSKSKVQDVLYSLYKNTDLQYTFSADLTCILDGSPVTLGVWGIIEKWVEWRREVLRKYLLNSIKDIEYAMSKSRVFLELISKQKECDEFCRLVMKVSREAGAKYLLENYDNSIITPELADWLTTRRISDFKGGGKYKVSYDKYTAELKLLSYNVEHIDDYIIRQLDELIASKKDELVRKTEVTTQDYNFSVSEDDKESYSFTDNSTCYYVLKENFIRKYRYDYNVPQGEPYMTAGASSTLVGIDNRGRVIRIYCKDIPYTSGMEIGTYIPAYLGIDENDEYDVVFLDVLDGSKKLVIYNDGYVGTLDTSEWLDCRKQVRVVERGVDNANASKIAGVATLNDNDWLYVCDNSGRIGCVNMSTVKQMNRTARKKVFDLKSDSVIHSYAVLNSVDGYGMLRDISKYCNGRLRFLDNMDELTGDINQFKTSIVG